MTLYLDEFKTFCREIASPDDSDSTADQEHLNWINDALADIVSRTGWDKYTKERKLNIPVEEEKTAVTLTQDSLAISISGDTFDAKYDDGHWKMHASSEGQYVFEVASVAAGGATATLRDGDEWVQATNTNETVYFTKEKFDLPDDAWKIRRVQVMQAGYFLKGVNPSRFDEIKSYYPSQRGSYPRYWTVRNQKIEIWPHPGSTRTKLGLSYFRAPPSYTLTEYQDSAATTEVDWPDHMRECLRKGILLQAAITQDDPPVPYDIAEREMLKSLKRWMSFDQERMEMSGPMTPNLEPYRRDGRNRSWSWFGDLTDV